MQSPLQTPPRLHVAIIMDGNGRWAAARGLPRAAGHRAGARAARHVVEAAPDAGVDMLTLYAFSADNWQRPPDEVAALFRLFRVYLLKETGRCVANGVRLAVIGRRDRIPADLRAAIERAEAITAGGSALELRIALDYSARDALVAAARAPATRTAAPSDREALAGALGRAMHAPGPARDVDLLIRTGGEQRLSDFLLWECAYAELHFTARAWPDFRADDLRAAIDDFRGRDRRFGRVVGAAS